VVSLGGVKRHKSNNKIVLNVGVWGTGAGGGGGRWSHGGGCVVGYSLNEFKSTKISSFGKNVAGNS